MDEELSKKVMKNWSKEFMMDKIIEVIKITQAYQEKCVKIRGEVYKCEKALEKLAEEHNTDINWSEVYK